VIGPEEDVGAVVGDGEAVIARAGDLGEAGESQVLGAVRPLAVDMAIEEAERPVGGDAR
jgi:hypothetical protein